MRLGFIVFYEDEYRLILIPMENHVTVLISPKEKILNT